MVSCKSSVEKPTMPLSEAILKENTQEIERNFAHNPKLKSEPLPGQTLTALDFAIAQSKFVAFEALLDLGAAVNAVSEERPPPLFTPVASDRFLDFTKMLVDRGANVNAASAGFTPLLGAAARGSSQTLEYLIEKGAKPTQSDIAYLGVALDLDVAQVLVDNGATLDQGKDGETSKSVLMSRIANAKALGDDQVNAVAILSYASEGGKTLSSEDGKQLYTIPLQEAWALALRTKATLPRDTIPFRPSDDFLRQLIEGGLSKDIVIKIGSDYAETPLADYLRSGDDYPLSVAAFSKRYGSSFLTKTEEPRSGSIGQSPDMNAGSTKPSSSSASLRYSQVSSRLMSDAEIESMSYASIRYAINECFAKYGLVFKTRDIQKHFEAQSWYRPTPGLSMDSINAKMTAIERSNIAKLSAAKRRKG